MLTPVTAVVILCLVIAMQAEKLQNMFDPDSFVSKEEQKETFDPSGYGLKEDGEKQGEEDSAEDSFEQEDQEQRKMQNPAADYFGNRAGGKNTEDQEKPAEKIVYVDHKAGEGMERQTGTGDAGGSADGQIPGGTGNGGRKENTDDTQEGSNSTPGDATSPETGDDENEPGESGDGGEEEEEPGDSEDEDTAWAADSLSVSYYRNQDAVSFYKEQVPSESYVRGNITVTSHWVDKNNPSNTRTKEETEFVLESIPEKYDHRLTDEDVNQSFTLKITCQGLTDTVTCVIKNDYIRFTGMRVHYDSSPVYVTGETLFQGEEVNDAPIRNAITLDVYGRTVQGGQDVYLPDESNYQVSFKEETGGVASKKEDGSQWEASILYCGAGEGSTVVLRGTDAVRYSVRDYKLTVMYDEHTVLDTIYTDDKTVVLNGTYDGRCPYNEMVRKLQENGKYTTNEEGYLTELFYGWSSQYPASVETREISYTFKDGQHTQVMYAIPLAPMLEKGYLVKTRGDDQILTGYVPEEKTSRLDIPYGITSVDLNDSFKISKEAENVETLALSATVNSVDLSAAGQKFPKLSEYSVQPLTDGETESTEKNHIFSAENGLLYSADKSTLWKVPAACQSFTVNEKVETVTEGALADAAAGVGKETLRIKMLAENPPELQRTEKTPVFGGASCQVQVEVQKTAESVIEDLVYKRYVSAWGEIFDDEFGKTGIAAESIEAEGGTEGRYENNGGDVYLISGDCRSLAFITRAEKAIYDVPEDAQAIAPYAFAEAEGVRFVNVGENIEKLESCSFAGVKTSSLQGVQINSESTMELGENLAGEQAPREIRFYISLAQNEASGWIKRLTKDYGAETAERMLTLAEGTLCIDEQGCAYLEQDDHSLMLCSAPEELSEYEVPEGYTVTEIAAGAFAWCGNLSYLELPDVNKVGKNAFKNCTDLEILVLSNPALSECADAFAGCDSLETVLLGNEELKPELPEKTELLAGSRYFAGDRAVYEKQTEKTCTILNVTTDVEGTFRLEDGVTAIGDRAFAGCRNLTDFDTEQMNQIESIGAYAFYECTNLKEALIGRSCRRIGECAYAGCSGLETVTWLGDTETVGNSVFSANKKLSAVYFGNDTGQSITDIGSRTFEECTALQTVYFQAGVKEIGDFCFRGCSGMWTSITREYAAACEKIGAYAFADCSRYAQTLAFYTGLKELGEGAFLNCTYLRSMWIPSQLRKIPEKCFAGCTSMRSLVVLADANLRSIGANAFSGCVALEELTNFNLLTHFYVLGESAFSGGTVGENTYGACTALKSISLPSSVRQIARYAFSGCTALETAAIEDAWNLTSLGEGVFLNCTSLKNGGLSETAIPELPADSFSGCSAMETLMLPETVTSIESRAVADCDALYDMTIRRRDGVVSVASNALTGTKNNGRISIYVPYTDKHTLRNAYRLSFDWWTALLNIFTGQSPVTIIQDREMGEETFVENGGLYERKDDGTFRLLQAISLTDGGFTVKENTTEISSGAFGSREDMSALMLPESLQDLPAGVFESCANLEILLVPDDLRMKFTDEMFGEGERNVNFTLWVSDDDADYYENQTELPVRAYGRQGEILGGVLYGAEEEEGRNRILLQYVPKNFKGELTLMLGTQEVAEEAAMGCQNLTAVNSAYTVEKIGAYAFADCSSLQTVDLTSLSATALTEIGDYAFAGCTNLIGENTGKGEEEELLIPSTVKVLGKGMLKDCSSLTNLSLQGNSDELPDEFCSGCENLQSLSLARTLLNSVTRIGKKAFYGCESITSVSWSNMPNLKIVDDGAYENCSSLVQVTFANQVEYIGDAAFLGTALEMLSFNGENPPALGENILNEEEQSRVHVYIPAGENGEIYLKYYEAWENNYPVLVSRLVAQDGSEYRAVNNILYLLDPEQESRMTAIRVPTNAASVQIYNSSALYCVRLEDGSFKNCRQITSLVIPNRVESIGDGVFENCVSLKDVSMEGEALRIIGEEAFQNCTSLTELEIPQTVYSLGDGMLEGCGSFHTLTVNSYTPVALGKKIFGETAGEDIRIKIPLSAYSAYLNQWGSQLDSEYGEGAGQRILMAVNEDGTEKIENGVHYVWAGGRWEEKADTDKAEKNTGAERSETDKGQPEAGEEDDRQTGSSETGGSETSEGQPEAGEEGDRQTGSSETGGSETSEGQPEAGEEGDQQTGSSETGGSETGEGQPETGEEDDRQTENSETDSSETGEGQPEAGAEDDSQTGTEEDSTAESKMTGLKEMPDVELKESEQGRVKSW